MRYCDTPPSVCTYSKTQGKTSSKKVTWEMNEMRWDVIEWRRSFIKCVVSYTIWLLVFSFCLYTAYSKHQYDEMNFKLTQSAASSSPLYSSHWNYYKLLVRFAMCTHHIYFPYSHLCDCVFSVCQVMMTKKSRMSVCVSGSACAALMYRCIYLDESLNVFLSLYLLSWKYEVETMGKGV